MKKTIILLISIIFVLSLSACGGDDTSESSQEATGNESLSQTDESNAQTGESDGDGGIGSEIKDAIDEGVTGSYERDGVSMEFGGNWPDFELFKGIPVPQTGTVASSAEDGQGMANVILVEMSKDECREYADELAGAGYDLNVLITDPEADMGSEYSDSMYIYSADNAEGTHVDLSFMTDMVTLQVSVAE